MTQVPVVVYEDEEGNLVTADTPGAIRRIVGDADAHINEQGDLIADARITDPSASKVTREMAGTMGPFSIVDEAQELGDMAHVLHTLQVKNAFLSLAESAERSSKAVRSYAKTAPYYVKVSHKDKAERRAKEKQARKSRKRNRK